MLQLWRQNVFHVANSLGVDVVDATAAAELPKKVSKYIRLNFVCSVAGSGRGQAVQELLEIILCSVGKCVCPELQTDSASRKYLGSLIEFLLSFNSGS